MGDTENKRNIFRSMFIMFMYTYVHVGLQTSSPWTCAFVDRCIHTHTHTHFHHSFQTIYYDIVFWN